MDYLRSGDTLFIYHLDRLGRFVKEMIDLCAQLENRRIKLVSLQDNLDTSTAVGRFTMQILAVSHWRSITAILFLKVAKPVLKQLKSEVLSLRDRKV